MHGNDQPTAVGSHVFGGGFTLGVSRVFNVTADLEEGPWGATTFDLNFPGMYHPLRREDWDLSRVRTPSLLFVNPPCAVWSNLGAGLGYADPRFAFTKTCFDLADQLQPEVFILESVCRAWTAGREYYASMAERLIDRGYGVTIFLTDGILHEGFQHRERFHFIAHRGRLDLREPRVRTVPSVGDAIEDLELTATLLDEEPFVPNHRIAATSPAIHRVLEVLREGEHFNDGVERLFYQEAFMAPRARFIAYRLTWDEPASTVVDIGCLFHPRQHRLITPREAARLCGYPDSFVLAANPRCRTFAVHGADLTQAVLPPMGEYLARAARESLGTMLPAPELTVIDWRRLGRKFRRSTEGAGDEIKKQRQLEKRARREAQ
jgi:DNA (cytosine-5)-methyltransferase 1